MNIEEQIALVAKINEATKDIPDEETRKLAFKSLLSSAGLAEATESVKPLSSAKNVLPEEDSGNGAPKKGKKPKSTAGKGAPDIDPELNLEPDGKPSFGDFVKKRTLTSNIDKISAAIYYLREILKLDKAGMHQAATCFKDQGWDWPSDFRNTISQGKKVKRFHYDGFDDIKLTAVEINSIKKETIPD